MASAQHWKHVVLLGSCLVADLVVVKCRADGDYDGDESSFDGFVSKQPHSGPRTEVFLRGNPLHLGVLLRRRLLARAGQPPAHCVCVLMSPVNNAGY
jgi:hypothetical protein